MSRAAETPSTPAIQSMISKSAPQEIKIQIKLAPPSSDGGLMSSGGELMGSSLGFLTSPGVRPVLKTPISISPMASVLSATQAPIGTPIIGPRSQAITPLIGQPVVQFPSRTGLVTPSISNTGSTPVKDLLAQVRN